MSTRGTKGRSSRSSLSGSSAASSSSSLSSASSASAAAATTTTTATAMTTTRARASTASSAAASSASSASAVQEPLSPSALTRQFDAAKAYTFSDPFLAGGGPAAFLANMNLASMRSGVLPSAGYSAAGSLPENSRSNINHRLSNSSASSTTTFTANDDAGSSGSSSNKHSHSHSDAQSSDPAANGAPLPSRKQCNCKNSRCLKLYCECFASGQYCDKTCNCLSCLNNPSNESTRKQAVDATLDRNPTAFRPKVTATYDAATHSKGCNCKKSNCLKKYCECYQAGIQCSSACRCLDCKNQEGSGGGGGGGGSSSLGASSATSFGVDAYKLGATTFIPPQVNVHSHFAAASPTHLSLSAPASSILTSLSSSAPSSTSTATAATGARKRQRLSEDALPELNASAKSDTKLSRSFDDSLPYSWQHLPTSTKSRMTLKKVLTDEKISRVSDQLVQSLDPFIFAQIASPPSEYAATVSSKFNHLSNGSSIADPFQSESSFSSNPYVGVSDPASSSTDELSTYEPPSDGTCSLTTLDGISASNSMNGMGAGAAGSGTGGHGASHDYTVHTGASAPTSPILEDPLLCSENSLTIEESMIFSEYYLQQERNLLQQLVGAMQDIVEEVSQTLDFVPSTNALLDQLSR